LTAVRFIDLTAAKLRNMGLPPGKRRLAMRLLPIPTSILSKGLAFRRTPGRRGYLQRYPAILRNPAKGDDISVSPGF
jgi:hypothetical protein